MKEAIRNYVSRRYNNVMEKPQAYNLRPHPVLKILKGKKIRFFFFRGDN